jgi:toluene monooxygenase system protein E
VKQRPPIPVAPRARLRTYSHLAEARRIPGEYDIATSRVSYHHTRGLEVELPFGGWYARHGAEATLPGVDWEAFADPERLTYRRYTALRAEHESFVGQLFARLDDAPSPSPAALDAFDQAVAPLRYPIHGLQMVAAYLGQLAPCGRVAIACAFQAADEIRRLQHVAYRMGQLRRQHPERPETSRARWQEDAAWQPLRRLVERLLVTWDWTEAFAALQLGIKPALDDWMAGRLAACLHGHGEHLFAEVLTATAGDARWSRAWSEALLALVTAAAPEPAAQLSAHGARWRDEASAAIATVDGGEPCR